jgi:nitrogen fixation/metabolism regulation signal transduction histidine kinase
MIPPQRCLVAMLMVLVAVAGLSAVITSASASVAFGIGASVGSAVLAGLLAFLIWVRPRLRALERLRQALAELSQGHVSVRLGNQSEETLGDLAVGFDAVGDALTCARAGDLKSRILAAIGGCSPVALLVYGEMGRIVYSNELACDIFFEGQNPEGKNFLHMLEQAPEPLRTALLCDTDGLFTLENSEERETYDLSKRYLDLDGCSYTLVMLKHLTREFGRREAELYKRVIRVISHEFNNSLAPIISLIRSAKLIGSKPEHLPKLEKVLETVEDRATHLNSFLEGYATFARLPRPRPQVVSWATFLDGIHSMWPAVDVGPPPAKPGFFDPAQMQQVLINLLKNAVEASRAEQADVKLAIETIEGGTLFSVTDRGQGMSNDVMKNALEPFFSTKERGSGVGLALCREIVEAHDGKLKIEPREGGGTVVSCWIPGQGSSATARTGRLTLSRA